METKNVSILLLNRADHFGLRSLTKTLALFFFLFTFISSLSCEKEKGVGPQSKTNSPPVIASVKILPENPDRERDLSLIIQSNDPDGDSITYRYEWIKNDGDMVGEDKSTLKAGRFKKGDVIQVKVTPSDGKEDGNSFLSSPVKILNFPPVIQEVWIEPKTPSARDNLKAFEKSVDADGDTIYFTYQWEKNGDLMDERGEVLEQGLFKKGDSITVTVIPDDRETLGSPKKSNPLTVLNSSPTIISSPPTSIEGTKYLYQVKATDPDDDPITYSLKSGPKSMSIDPTTGLIQWEIQREDKGTQVIEIEVVDNGGGRSNQRYTLVIEFK